MIELIHVRKQFGDLIAVDDLSLTIPAGEFFAMLGPNAAGKTTTLKILAGLMKPTSGTARVGGFDVQRQPLEARARQRLESQSPSVAPRFVIRVELVRGERRRGSAATWRDLKLRQPACWLGCGTPDEDRTNKSGYWCAGWWTNAGWREPHGRGQDAEVISTAGAAGDVGRALPPRSSRRRIRSSSRV